MNFIIKFSSKLKSLNLLRVSFNFILIFLLTFSQICLATQENQTALAQFKSLIFDENDEELSKDKLKSKVNNSHFVWEYDFSNVDTSKLFNHPNFDQEKLNEIKTTKFQQHLSAKVNDANIASSFKNLIDSNSESEELSKQVFVFISDNPSDKEKNSVDKAINTIRENGHVPVLIKIPRSEVFKEFNKKFKEGILELNEKPTEVEMRWARISIYRNLSVTSISWFAAVDSLSLAGIVFTAVVSSYYTNKYKQFFRNLWNKNPFYRGTIARFFHYAGRRYVFDVIQAAAYKLIAVKQNFFTIDTMMYVLSAKLASSTHYIVGFQEDKLIEKKMLSRDLTATIGGVMAWVGGIISSLDLAEIRPFGLSPRITLLAINGAFIGIYAFFKLYKSKHLERLALKLSNKQLDPKLKQEYSEKIAAAKIDLVNPENNKELGMGLIGKLYKFKNSCMRNLKYLLP